ncbi:MAG: DUF6794 domain-containing protein [Cyclobacteriaceae bacterium]
MEGKNLDLDRKYKHYPFEIYCAIDSTGSCTELHIDMKEPLYRSEIVDFLRNVKFDKKEIPAGIDKWYFHYLTGFRKKSKSVAARERREQLDIEKLEYGKRILKDSIDEIYIPSDVEDCFSQLDQMLDSKDKSEFKNLSEDEAGGRYHMGLGLWMRNNWALWRGSRLSNYFNKLGIKHPDDMSGIILRSYHRNLNGRDIQLDEQVREYQKK